MRRGKRNVFGTLVKPPAVCVSMLRVSVDERLVHTAGKGCGGSRVVGEAMLVLPLRCRSPLMMHLRSYAHGFAQG